MNARIIFLDTVPHLVTDAQLVTVHTERQVGKETLYGSAQYTAVEVRPASREEADEWRKQ